LVGPLVWPDIGGRSGPVSRAARRGSSAFPVRRLAPIPARCPRGARVL